MCTHGPKGGSAPREDPKALMCTHGPKGGSKGLDVYTRLSDWQRATVQTTVGVKPAINDSS